MANLDAFKNNYQQFPQLPEMKKLCHFNYWDGPLSGLCLINGNKYWYECVEEWLDNNRYPDDDDDFEPPWYRRYLIWKLTDEQLAAIEARHAKFQRMVGTHTDYSEDGKERGRFHYNETVTPETFKQFYEEAKLEKPIDITPNASQIIGWWEWK
jgi:hypothetical protein